MTTLIDSVETAPVESESRDIIQQARALIIADDLTYQQAGALAQSIRAVKNKIVAIFKEPKRAAKAAHGAVCDAEGRLLDPLDEAEAVLKHGGIAYQQAQEAIRREEQARLQAEAQKREEDARLAEAEAMVRMGRPAEAEAHIARPVEAPTVILPRAVPKVAGFTPRANWQAECIDLPALVRFVAANPAWGHLLEPNTTTLRQYAQQVKGVSAIPGVRVWNAGAMAVKG